ncbi:MAG TPA: glycerate kinase [Ignavibacteria bacterium]|nr:glycerate kinase [Ignavibacteria bacterium]
MKFLVCPDSFKGTMSAGKVSEIISSELRKAGYDAEAAPIADGGEGTLEAIASAVRCRKRFLSTMNPLKKRISSYYAFDKKTAYMEYAVCCGLHLINEKDRNPLKSTSAGFGILLDDALKLGMKKIYIGIGGSATNDAGAGMLQALGVKFYNKKGEEISQERILTAEDLNEIYDFDASSLFKKINGVDITVLSDVKNPLTGKNGATYVYSQQKGAKKNQLKIMDNNIKHFASIVKSKMNVNPEFPGAGASGGLGFALKIFLNGTIVPGVEGVSKILRLDEKIPQCDVVIVGEGALDYQTAFGKAPWGVAKMAKKYNKYVAAISGKAGEGADELLGTCIDTIYAGYNNIKITDKIRTHSENDLKKTVRKFIRDFQNNNLKNKITLIYGRNKTKDSDYA